jgi:opacity protein-like surface antigen
MVPWRWARVGVCAAVLVLAPGRAQADGWLTAFYGVAYNDFTPEDSKPKSWGFGFGSMGRGVVGFETEVSFSPDFFGESEDFIVGDNSVFTWMNNMIIGVPIGGQSGFGVRPFLTGGVGLVRQRVESVGDLLDFSNNGFAYDFGAGVMVFFGKTFGVRADYRYYSNFETNDLIDFITSGKADAFEFTRITGAVVFRF